MFNKDISIIIVSWKVKDLLRHCLRSIYRETIASSFEILVVDNASGDGTAEMVKTEFPSVQLIENRKNYGFATANNQAIKKASGEFVLLLNPDTVIIDQAIDRMVAWFKQAPAVGIAGCRLINPDGTGQSSVRRFPTISALSLILLKLHRIFPRLKPLRAYLCQDFDYQKAGPVDQVMGAFFMIRRAVLDKIGLLDGRYHLWFEEVDYCLRAKKHGFKVFYYPGARIIHHFGQSFQQVMSLKKQIIMNNSLLYYFRKNGMLAQALVVVFLYLPSLITSLGVTLFLQPFKK